MTLYHHAAHTLDKEIEDDAPLGAGHDAEAAEAVKEISDQFREGVQAQSEAEAERAREWAERDPKPKPSEFVVEQGWEPAAEDATSDSEAGSVSDPKA